MYANWGTLKHATSGSYDIGEGKEGLMFSFHISIRALSLLRCKAFFHDVILFCALNNRTPNYQEREAFTIIYSFFIGYKMRFGVKMFQLLIFFCLMPLLHCLLLFCSLACYIFAWEIFIKKRHPLTDKVLIFEPQVKWKKILGFPLYFIIAKT